MYLFITLKSVGTSPLNVAQRELNNPITGARPLMLEHLHFDPFTKCPDDSSEATPTTTETKTPERQSILLMTAARQRLLPLKSARPILLSRRSTLIHLH